MGSLTEATPESVYTAVGARVVPHLWLAKALVPLLAERPSSSYTVVTGALGEVGRWMDGSVAGAGQGGGPTLPACAPVGLQGCLPGQALDALRLPDVD